MIADVAFDVPVPHPFSYRVPDGLPLVPGQRVIAPLRGAARIGMVVSLREGADSALKPVTRLADAAPVLLAAGLDLARWVSAQSFSSIGATCAALLPPPARGAASPAASRAPEERATRTASPAAASRPELLIGSGREKRLLERMEASGGTMLVIAADVETSARWAQRLGRIGAVARLDSGVADAERAAAWRALAAGSARLATGTRSALLAPLPPPATLVLLDEHDPAHRPPGPPRIHAREVLLERAERERCALLCTSATPSVEMWWRADSGRAAIAPAPPGPWPAVSLADTRGIFRREPLTPALARAIRETLAAKRRVLLGVSRLASSLACDECGTVVRCDACLLALAYRQSAVALACRLCGRHVPLPDTCPACRGRRLSPFGWGGERVEHAVRRRFPGARIARYDPDAVRGARAEAQRQAAATADVVIGTRGALRLFGPATLGLAGLVSPDQLLRIPDFRAGERALAFLWAAAERVGASGRLIVQSQHPTHYVYDAVARQDLTVFYRHELRFRAELGYPPFRRLALVSVSGDASPSLAERIHAALRASSALTVYPPAPDRRNRVHRIVVKGAHDLPESLEAALAEFRGPRPRSRGIMDVEVDPVEWPS